MKTTLTWKRFLETCIEKSTHPTVYGMPRANWLRYDADQTDGQLIASNYQRQWVGRSSMTFLSHGHLYWALPCPAAAWQIRYKSDIEAPLFNAWICVRYILISRWDDHHVGSFSLSYIWICRNRYLRLLRYEFRHFWDNATTFWK